MASKDMDITPDESSDINMDMGEDYTIDDLTQGIENLKVDPEYRQPFFRQGNSESKNLQRAQAAECKPYSGEERAIPNDEIIYIIAAHGIWNDTDNFRGHKYPQGHGPIISAPVDFWEDLNMGVLVSEGTLLHSKTTETRQQAVMRHIAGIIGGKIKVFQRFPWRTSLQDTNAIFPNIIFGEGGDCQNPFVSTIARYYKGQIVFFQLKRSVDAGRLITFNERGEFPVNDAANPLNLNSTNMVLLSQLLGIINNDVAQARAAGNDIKKVNMAFASCMENVPDKYIIYGQVDYMKNIQ